jgi:hypothetical protein
LWEISKTQKKKGFFLAREMNKRGIVGLHKGLSKHIKLSVYGLSDEELERVATAFEEIAKMWLWPMRHFASSINMMMDLPSNAQYTWGGRKFVVERGERSWYGWRMSIFMEKG